VAQAVARAADRWGAAGALGRGPAVALAPHAARAVLRDGAPTAPTTLDAPVHGRWPMPCGGTPRLAGPRRADGAVLVVDNASGDVLAYVGGAGDVSSARYVDGVRARRQAGSALKRSSTPRRSSSACSRPVVARGYAAGTDRGRGLYRPRNYDERFRGVVTARAGWRRR